jgi:hypothetical protein
MRKLVVLAFAATIVSVAVFGAWHRADNTGWFPHHEVTATYLGQNGWMPGEYRDCIAVPTREGKLSPFVGVFGGYLACDAEGHAKEDLSLVIPHHLSITFWGKITRRPQCGNGMAMELSSEPGIRDLLGGELTRFLARGTRHP